MHKQFLRRAAAATLSLAMMASMACTAGATTGSQPVKADYSNIKVALDGKYVILTDAEGASVEPFAVDGTTYLPLRAVASALGLNVEWDSAVSTAVLTTGGQAADTTRIPPDGRTISITQSADYADIKVTLDGRQLSLTDVEGNTVEPFAINGTIYLPLRAIATALGLEVSWDSEDHVAYLSTEPFTISADEATFLVQGNLDEFYLNKASDTYLKMLGITAEQVEANYLQNVLGESKIFCFYWGIVDPDYGESFEDLDSNLVNQITTLCQDIYTHTKYTVADAVAVGNGNYTVEVTVSPINVMDLAAVTYDAGYDEFEAQHPNRETDEEWLEYCNDYALWVIGLVKDQMPNLGYLPDETITLRVEKDADGYFAINTDDLYNLAMRIIDYPTVD